MIPFARLFGRRSAIPRLDDLDAAIEASLARPVLIYKHSRRCHFCVQARQSVAALSLRDDVEVREIVVQYDRKMSRLVEDRFNLFHQTPQALLLWHGRCVWSASQSAVTHVALSNALDRLQRS